MSKDTGLEVRESPQRILDRVVDGEKAWLRADIQRDDWFFELSPECLDELRSLTPELRLRKKPVDQIDAGGLALPACRAFMKRVQSAQPLDQEAAEAIDALKTVFLNESLSLDFVMERGQMQFANNRELCHRRTRFEDFDDPNEKRLLMRIWMRNAGSTRYPG